MKKLLFSFLLGLAGFQSIAQNEVENDAELGSLKDYFYTCWSLDGFSLSDDSDHVIEGEQSFIVKASENQGRGDMKSPWIKLADGKVELEVKPTSEIEKTTVYALLLPYDSENKVNGESNDYVYLGYSSVVHKGNSATKSVKVKFNYSNKLIGELYKVYLIFIVDGDEGATSVDNLVIPGEYYSDPSADCLPKGEKKDADGDGVADDEDDYPDDKYKAYNNYLTPEGAGTLMFEDLWPATGDYDFNDLVLDYMINRITDASGEIVEVVIDLLPRAAGAGYSNGFGIEFTGISTDQVYKVVGSKIKSNSIHEFLDNGLEAGNEYATIIAFDDVDNVLTHPGGGAVGINTDPNFPMQSVEKMQITMYIKDGGNAKGHIQLGELKMDNFNPFLIVNQKRGVEIHLPGKTPTAHVDKSLFGTKEDNSNGDEEAYYRGKDNGLPWALNVTESIPYMMNKESITTGYQMFYKWAATGGEAYPDWYEDKDGYRLDKVLLNAK
ncbi:LruC domain-containing protein [Cyclobacterium sp. 1_MG-2023]|uniref:LruC domain-containing protein n=1 Tax=Cyclobacterium sp. 1_MG-2023 TaxID=3062681 RepID=UPI0026E463FD|nr:LruC domain-containing protein [Cyclobacterium sp. 1_MG-2023]MDO6439797.1 LruC domain-containing protein [Cyclobacterium sp. 1_MG-2023]